MTVLTRRVAARPARTASEVWGLITELLFASCEEGRRACGVASGLAASVVAEEIPARSPFVLTGAGPRVRIYTLYDEEALDEPDEAPVQLDLEGHDWLLWLPCAKEDIGWAEPSIKASPRLRLYDAAQGIPEGASTHRGSPAEEIQIDLNLFRDL